jgi:hypothetical protein
MSSYINAELRRDVEFRAHGVCEYCRIHQNDTWVGCHVDHIIAIKHGGQTEFENLAFACAVCNRAKGTDIASVASQSGAIVRLFNPRLDGWHEHFRFDDERALIVPLSEIGEVTARLLDFNETERIVERKSLMSVGRYPT